MMLPTFSIITDGTEMSYSQEFDYLNDPEFMDIDNDDLTLREWSY